MKVLYIDPTSPFGHKNHNYGILRSLVKLANVDVLARRDPFEITRE